MNKITLERIARENDLEIIETTSQMNGYPSQLEKGLVGFKSFQQMEDLSDKYKFSPNIFKKTDGWQLWYRTDNMPTEEFSISSEDYGDDYMSFDKESIESFYDEEIKPFLEEQDNIEDTSED